MIYFTDDSEIAEYEFFTRGFRNDIYVQINNNYYNLNVYTISRLQYEFDIAWNFEKYYLIDPNIILVNEIKKPEIILTINQLDKRMNFFKDLKPIDKKIVKKLKLIKIN